MSGGKLRWGLLSTAKINKSVIPAIRDSSQNELVAVASREKRRAESFAQQWDIPIAHGSYEGLLNDPAVDVVYVSVPNGLHAEWAIKSADAGKHVLCEKPMALSLEEVDRIVAAAERNKVIILEGMMFRYHPQIRRVQELVEEGAIGKVRLIRASFSFPANLSGTDSGTAKMDPGLGGGSLWDVGCYPVSFARAVVGSDPIEVAGMQTMGPAGVDLTFVGEMSYNEGTLAQFDTSFQAPLRWHSEIVGGEGVILLDEPWNHRPDSPTAISLRRADGDETIDVDKANAYRCEVEALAACVNDGAQSPLPLSETRGNISTVLALRESALRGEVVNMQGRAVADG